MQKFDYIITGGGCAGLSLAYQLLKSPLQHKSILLIEKEDKDQNDRTWCFWEEKPGPFEEIIYHHWKTVHFFGSSYSQLLDMSPYRYKMIRGIDFYQFAKKEISLHPNITCIKGKAENLQNFEEGASVTVNSTEYQGKWIFNSIRNAKAEKDDKSYNLLQHFKGWVIQTDSPIFNSEKATLMDFRIDQHNETRFVYVLPTSSNQALVEFTVFSPELLPKPEYDAELTSYISEFLHINQYQLLQEEFGVIPMTDYSFPKTSGEHIINLGTSGGQTKASTGYTFTRIQEHTNQLINALLVNGSPTIASNKWQNRFQLYDSTLLNVLLKNRMTGKDVFTRLFRKNKPETVFRFLEEKTNLLEEFKILNSVPSLPFMKGMLQASLR